MPLCKSMAGLHTLSPLFTHGKGIYFHYTAAACWRTIRQDDAKWAEDNRSQFNKTWNKNTSDFTAAY